MKRTIITILLVSASIIGFSQSKTTAVKGNEIIPDSVTVDTPILSINDMEKLNQVIMKQFDLTENSKYLVILKELQTLIAEGQKKFLKQPIKK